MPLFTPDIVQFGDDIGMGLWINSHFYEHQQFTLIGLQQGIEFVDYDLLGWIPGDETTLKGWQEAHNAMHDSLRYPLNVEFQPFDAFDLHDEQSWYWFMLYHAQEHAALRQALGVT
jgi:hypothetical protein